MCEIHLYRLHQCVLAIFEDVFSHPMPVAIAAYENSNYLLFYRERQTDVAQNNS